MDGRIPVPCGKCPTCLKRRISGWSFRLTEHAKTATSALGVTLTYANGQLSRSKAGYLTLNKRDAQLFFKRLRKCRTPQQNLDEPIKYYLCGEYGGKTFRPHYHAIIFNSNHNDIMQSWLHGSVHFATPTAQWVGYTLKYMSKPKRIPMHAKDDRLREFSLMSKGLGQIISGRPP